MKRKIEWKKLNLAQAKFHVEFRVPRAKKARKIYFNTMGVDFIWCLD